MTNPVYILGVNGWFEDSHDASACLLKDGELLVMIEEERLSRKKHSFDTLPYRSIQACLDFAEITVDDINHIAIGWDYAKKTGSQGKLFHGENQDLLNFFLPYERYLRLTDPTVHIIPHHLAHAASAFRTSQMSEAAILVIDGAGESQSISFGFGSDQGIMITRELSIIHSLGYFFEAWSRFLGFSSMDTGKLMGLAGHGHPETVHFYRCEGSKIQINHLEDDEWRLVCRDKVHDFWRVRLGQQFSSRLERDGSYDQSTGGKTRAAPITPLVKNLAATAQLELERVVFQLSQVALEQMPGRPLVLSGGVAYNCSVNGKLSNALNCEVFIPPVCGDAGVSLGAALEVSSRLGNKDIHLKSASWGQSFSAEQIENILEQEKIEFRRLTYREIVSKAATLLAVGNVIGWFQGRAEVGPRALGNRSILASPVTKEMHARVNAIKQREQWRPLAPMILKKYASDFLVSLRDAPFMLKADQIKAEQQHKIPAVVHVDGTTRPQLVDDQDLPLLAQLLTTFAEFSGVPVLLNTSFNLHDEPIVYSPQDAVKTFTRSGLDALIIENYFIQKPR